MDIYIILVLDHLFVDNGNDVSQRIIVTYAIGGVYPYLAVRSFDYRLDASVHAALVACGLEVPELGSVENAEPVFCPDPDKSVAVLHAGENGIALETVFGPVMPEVTWLGERAGTADNQQPKGQKFSNFHTSSIKCVKISVFRCCKFN